MSKEQAISAEDAVDEALPPGSKLLSEQYEIIRYLSSGGFGITYLARDSLNRTVVIKECFPEAFCSRVNRTVRARTQNYIDDFRSIVRLFIREAHALSRLNHPSVVGVHQVFEDNETAYMALDLVDGSDLLAIVDDSLASMAASQVHQMTLALLDAISHVHSQDMLHRDISPDNILVDETGRPVMIDFGAAREEASRKSRVLSAVLVVKDGYSPQEFYIAGSQQLPCSDLYAFAATLVHLITGKAPPNSQARLSALASNQPDLYQPLSGRYPEYEDVFLTAIDKAMNIVPADRIQSAEEWVLMIDHEKRVEIARSQARQDKSIDETVMHIVATANTAALSLDIASPDRIRGCGSEVSTPLKPAEQPDPPKAVENLTPEYEYTPLLPKSEQPEPEKLSPYLRVTSKAIALREVGLEQVKTENAPAPRLSRFISVPIVFFAYFFYTHFALQIDVVHAATVQPILNLSAELSDIRTSRSEVTIHRAGVN